MRRNKMGDFSEENIPSYIKCYRQLLAQDDEAGTHTFAA
jgi:hypothetical protein